MCLPTLHPVSYLLCYKFNVGQAASSAARIHVLTVPWDFLAVTEADIESGNWKGFERCEYEEDLIGQCVRFEGIISRQMLFNFHIYDCMLMHQSENTSIFLTIVILTTPHCI